MEDYSHELLRSGIIDFRAGDRASARRYIERAIDIGSDHNVLAEAWYYMSQLAEDPVEQRKALENCLYHDLGHMGAHRDLALLEGKLKREEIINPDDPTRRPTAPLKKRSSAPASDTEAPPSDTEQPPSGPEPAAADADAQRFMCPQCGARMRFSPDGHGLLCDNCGHSEPLDAAPPEPAGSTAQQAEHKTVRHRTKPRLAIDRDTHPPSPDSGAGRPGTSATDQDFLLAMIRMRGHTRPLAEQVFHCQGCGAEFILPPAQLSINCPYCGSPHVISFEKSPDLIAPERVIPHAFSRRRVTAMLRDWLQKNLPAGKAKAPENRPDPRGLYLPVWTFDLGGAIEYTGEVVADQGVGFGGQAVHPVHISDSYPVMLSRVPVPASRKLSVPLSHLLGSFDLKSSQPYDPRYLADWPAELYDIPLAEASLDARSQGYARLKRDMEIRLAPLHLISASSANLTIESFALDLLPVWIAEVVLSTGNAGRKARSTSRDLPSDGAQDNGEPSRSSHLVLVNGQTGDIYGDLASNQPHSGKLLSWLSDLVGE